MKEVGVKHMDIMVLKELLTIYPIDGITCLD